MNALDKMIYNHKTKSNQLKKAKRKLKNKTRNSLPIHELEALLQVEKSERINPQNYMGYDGGDEGYERDLAAKEARVDLLQNLICRIKENRK